MRRALALIAALLAAASLAAQSGEPSEKSVLEKAREKFQAARGEEAAGQDLPFAPVYLAFTPGLSVPYVYCDVGFSGAAIGALSRDVYGFQGAGVFNLSRHVLGFQGAGVFNLAASVNGFQGAGVFNIAEGRVAGFQGAGVFNIAAGGVDGGQIAGVFNIAEELRAPVQLAGVFNIGGDVEGVQVSGVFNIAEGVKGAQVASVFNRAERIDGVQIGLVNVADRLEGIQIGLVNIARNGVNGLGFVYEPETDYAYAYWQNGSPHLYTIFQAGLPREDWFERGDNLVLSFGLGSRLRFGRSGPYLDLDLSASREIGPYMASFKAGLEAEDWEGAFAAFPAYPYPSLRLSLGIPVLGRLQLVGGFRFDIDLEDYSGLPESLKTGARVSSHDWFGLRFDSYSKVFVGLRL